MFSLTLCFGPQGTIWNFLFKTAESLDKARNSPVIDGQLVFCDDFGQSVNVKQSEIHGVMVEDLEQSQMGQVERGLHNARTQAKAQTRALADPSLAAAIRAQGPAVHSPFPNGRFNG